MVLRRMGLDLKLELRIEVKIRLVGWDLKDMTLGGWRRVMYLSLRGGEYLRYREGTLMSVWRNYAGVEGKLVGWAIIIAGTALMM